MSVRLSGAAPVLTEEAHAAVQRGERVIISVEGHDTVAVVPVADAYFLDALEDAQDAAVARANMEADAASREPPVTLAEARQRLGL